MNRRPKRVSDAEKQAREEFKRAVFARHSAGLPYARCIRTFMAGHSCEGPLDAHHVIRAQTLRAHTSTLPEDEALRIVYDPRNGVLVCRRLHAPLTTKYAHLKARDLSACHFEFAFEHGLEWALERELHGPRPFDDPGAYGE